MSAEDPLADSTAPEPTSPASADTSAQTKNSEDNSGAAAKLALNTRGSLLGATATDYVVLRALGKLGGARTAVHLLPLCDRLSSAEIDNSLFSLSISGFARRNSEGRYEITIGGELATS